VDSLKWHFTLGFLIAMDSPSTLSSNLFWQMIVITLKRHLQRSLYRAIRQLGYFFFWRGSPQWARASSFTKSLDSTQGRTTVSRTPLYYWSALRRVLYLTTHNTHNRQTSMPKMGFELTISAGERPPRPAFAISYGILIVKWSIWICIPSYMTKML
jgi:hypothetical protein